MSRVRTCSMRSIRAGSGNAPGWENTRTCSRKTMRVGMDLIPAQAYPEIVFAKVDTEAERELALCFSVDLGEDDLGIGLGRDQVHSHPHGLPRAGPRVLPTGGVAGARPYRPHRAGSDPRHGRGACARRAGNVGLTGCVPAAGWCSGPRSPDRAQPRPEAIA